MEKAYDWILQIHVRYFISYTSNNEAYSREKEIGPDLESSDDLNVEQERRNAMLSLWAAVAVSLLKPQVAAAGKAIPRGDFFACTALRTFNN